MQARIDAIDTQLAAIDQQDQLLIAVTARPANEPAPASGELRGAAIRHEAIRLLIAGGRHDGIHYRDWYGLLVNAGYTVAGQDPLAAFLTNISRSPIVRPGDRPGVKRLDLGAAQQIAAELAAAHRDLAAVAEESARHPERHSTLGGGQRHLLARVRRLEREHAEAVEAVEHGARAETATLEETDPTLAVIQRVTAEHFGISVTELLARSRDRDCWPRQLAMRIARDITPSSLPAIGRAFAGRDHTTVMTACQRAQERIAHDPGARHDHDTVRSACLEPTGSAEAMEQVR